MRQWVANLGLYRLDLAYVGTTFTGWQTQPEKNSVQDHLEKAISTFLRHDVKVIGASRTDSGVHAEHQVAVFETTTDFDPLKLRKGCNALLPTDIKLHKVQGVNSDFHPITSSKAKLYRYRIWLDPAPNPFTQDYSWQVYHLDVKKLREALPYFVGRHNFKSFCASDSNVKTFHRRLIDIKLVESSAWCEIYVLGEGFLKQMVRNIVGTLVDVGLGKISCHQIPDILKREDRKAAGRTAPAHGLSLVKIYFEEPPTSIQTPEKNLFSFAIQI